jgi:NADPH:quinone reductase-like Zn-dependent oxidoreductase
MDHHFDGQVYKIRAAVLRKKGGPLKIESLEMEGPRDDEVLVRLVASGICRTDIWSAEKILLMGVNGMANSIPENGFPLFSLKN